MPCTRCAHLREAQVFGSPAQLERALADVRANVADGTLAEADYRPAPALCFDQPPFAHLGPGPWPDVFAYDFRCAGCGAVYRFSAETYHGRGGEWRPIESAI
jgi:hypothetical protein